MRRGCSTEIVCVETSFMAKTEVTPPNIQLVLLAAGASSRMRGQDKLLKTIDGVSLLRRVTQACATSKATAVTVVLRPEDTARRAVIADLGVTLSINHDYQEGMATSLRAGIFAVPLEACDGVIIALGDMPDIRATDINRLIASFDAHRPEMICRATSAEGQPGNPVLFGRSHFDALIHLTGDHGAKSILTKNAGSVCDVALPQGRALTDLDQPEDWARYFTRPRTPG